LRSLDPFFPWEAFVMDLGVSPAGILRVPSRVKTMAVCDMSVVGSLVMCARFVVLGGFMMMVRRLTVMLCGGGVMFDRLFRFRHYPSPKLAAGLG
jgi:hypothetical protein